MEVTLDEVVSLVRRWLADAARLAPDPAARRLTGLLADPAGLDFTTDFVDGVVRPEDNRVAARRLAEVAAVPPDFLTGALRGAVRVGGVLGPKLPAVVVPVARAVLRRMLGHLVLDARPAPLGRALGRIRSAGVVPNLSLLGEAVLGDAEVNRRLATQRRLLARDDVDHLSVKVSGALGPHAPWGFEEAVAKATDRLRPLFVDALASGSFLTLDVEEFRDRDLTVAVFTRLLDLPELPDLSAGIALQAYLPDSLAVLGHLQEWAAARVAADGAPIKVRLVKGANLPAERVTAELRGWPVPVCDSKQATDTNYKRILDFALRPEHVRHVRIGLAGHNLFDLAWAWLLAGRRGVRDGMDVEMLLGMASAQAEMIRREVGRLWVYAPVVHPQQFDVALPYLARRLQEAADEQNFMSAIFRLDEEELFVRERDRFAASLAELVDAPTPPHAEPTAPADSLNPLTEFSNTADTDPAHRANRAWARHILERVSTSRLGIDRNTTAAITDPAVLDQVLATGHTAGREWGRRPGTERARFLRRVAASLAGRRAELIEVAAAECGKLVDQSDPEVSEAIDFANYYAMLAEQSVDGARFTPVALTVVTPPWNFPIAIPTGSTLAALAAGSAVILKPAPQARRCAAVLAEAMWAAGVPDEVLQLADVAEDDLGLRLISDPRVERVVLTGAYETAQLFRSFRPELRLLGETSGKNALVITPSADLELAVPDLVNSAFGHAGQKCSAASLAITVGTVTGSRRFTDLLVDAVRSLTVGEATDPASQVGPLIAPAAGKLREGLTTLAPGEEWLLKPRRLDDTGRLWTPGIRSGVRGGSPFHQIEYFGPVLGLMHADTLDEAIELQNAVPYGLTAGLHSLDAGEIAHWVDRVRAGNLYVNRGITGAIVQRQPFGGWKKSAVGAGSKAGGPNYLFGFGTWNPARAKDEAPLLPVQQELWRVAEECGLADERVRRSLGSDAAAWVEQYGRAADPSGLWCEQNVLRYRRATVLVRCGMGTHPGDLLRVVAAGCVAGARLLVSTAEPLPVVLGDFLRRRGVSVAVCSDAEWLAGFVTDAERDGVERIRLVGGDGDEALRRGADRPELGIFDHPVTESGRVELLPFLREQSISVTAHRFGQPHLLWTPNEGVNCGPE